MRYLSLFSGIEAASVAWEPLGWECVGVSEIEPFPSAVLAHRFPNVINFGDVTKITFDIVRQCMNNQGMANHKNPDYECAVEMYEMGMSIADVAEFVGVTRQAAHVALKRRGCKFRSNLKYGEENHFHRGGVLSHDKTHNILEYAIRKGIIKRKPCEICGGDGKCEDGRARIHAHHDDYNFPLRVRWLCQKHHHEWHQKNKAIPRKEELEPGSIDIVIGGFP